jgi:5-carboxymethyl-2-hydroxymuconate isomerase
MPHLTLEYSANVRETTDLKPLFFRLHELLSEIAGIDVRNCKSRARLAEDFLVSEGSDRDAFVHLDVRFLQGRSADVKKDIGAKALGLLREWFAGSSSALALQITVEVREIERGTYFKHPEGTLASL